MKKSKTGLSKKQIILSICLVFVAALVTAIVFGTINAHAPQTNPTSPQSPAPSQPEKPKIITIAAMGDMLAHDTIINNAQTDDGYDFGAYFKQIRPTYANADFVFCNQEGPSAGTAYGISGYPAFNAPTAFSKGLSKGAGCNIIGLANNHMGDKGIEATSATLDVWRQLDPVAVSGANTSQSEQENSVKYFSKDDIRLAFVAFADFNNNPATPAYSVNIYHDSALQKRLLERARQNADVVIVSMHWGVEDSNSISADQQEQVKRLANLGVDVVIGTGPHVLQPVHVVERPDGKTMTVWYSLGNLLSSQLKLEELIGGVALFDIVKDKENISINNLRFVPTYMHYEWTAAEKAADNLLARRNVGVYLLKNASLPLSRSLFATNVSSQFEYVKRTLGPEVKIVE